MKNIFSTKSFWTGLAAALTGVGLILSGDTSTGIIAIINGVGLIVGRDAILKVENK